MKNLNSSFFQKSPFLAKSGLNVQCSCLRRYCNFAIGKTFLLPPFDVPSEERRKLDAFLEILEDSGIGPIIEKCTRKSYRAGRKPYNPYHLFAIPIRFWRADKRKAAKCDGLQVSPLNSQF